MFAEVKDPLVQRSKRAVEEVGYETNLSKTKLELLWTDIIILIILHIGGLYGMFLRSDISTYTAIFLKASVLFATLGTVIGHHRLWSHRSFKANTILQIVLVIAASGFYQFSIYHWAKDHRLHHKYTETNADPHNSRRGFFYSHIGWFLVKKQRDVIKKGKEMDFSDLENNPIVMFQHKYYPYFILIFFLSIPTFIPWYFWGESLERAFYVCVLYRFILLLHIAGTGTSLLHSVGYKTYNKKIMATDNPVCHVVNLGEGFHNFHHTFPMDYRGGEFNFDFRNISGIVIFMLYKLGLAYDLKETPKSVINIWTEKYGDHSYDSNKKLNRFLWVQDSIIQLIYLLFLMLYIYMI